MELTELNKISFDIAELATPLIGISIAMLLGFALSIGVRGKKLC